MVNLGVKEMRYIGVIYTETGYDYLGPESAEYVRKEMRWQLDNLYGKGEVTSAYIFPFDEETSMPNADADPIFTYNREKL